MDDNRSNGESRQSNATSTATSAVIHAAVSAIAGLLHHNSNSPSVVTMEPQTASGDNSIHQGNHSGGSTSNHGDGNGSIVAGGSTRIESSSSHPTSTSVPVGTTTVPALSGQPSSTSSTPLPPQPPQLPASQTLTHTNSMPAPSTAPFQLINLPNRLVLDNVYLNGLHSLRRFGIRNTSSTDLLIKMRSSLGAQISFQLTNENLPFDPAAASAGGLSSVSTNTAAAAEAGSLTATGHQFNQLFNHVNLIGEVLVPAGATEYVILGFLPDPRGKNRRSKWDTSTLDAGNTANTNNSASGSALNEGVQIMDDSRQRDMMSATLSGHDLNDGFDINDQQSDSFDSFEVNGLLFFFAYKINPIQRSGSATLTGQNPSSILSTSPSSSGVLESSADQETLSPETASSAMVPLGAVTTPSAPHKADYQHTIKFRSTVCRSVLYSNVGETGIDFDDCVANQEYVKDFTIWNRSEIPLYWQLTAVDVSYSNKEEWLKFVDYEGDTYGYRRIRVIFRPRENGDFLFDLTLENLNDASNIEEANMHATVRAVSRGEDTLVISTGTTMDFGDCCAGMWTRQWMTLSNTGLTPLEVHLKVEGAEVVFDLQTDQGTDLPAAEAELLETEDDYDSVDHHHSWAPSSRRSEVSSHNSQQRALSASTGRRSMKEWVADGASTSGTASQNSSPVNSSEPRMQQRDRIESLPSSPITSDSFLQEAGPLGMHAGIDQYMSQSDTGRSNKHDDEQGSEVDASSLQDSPAPSLSMLLKKRSSLRSISFSGAHREKENLLRQAGSDVKGNQSTTRIEELFIKPGKERTVIVSYRPQSDPSIETFQAGKLLRKTFRIQVSYAPWSGVTSATAFANNPQRDRKIIQCKARACTSFVTVEPKVLDFGDADVGALKSLPIKLINFSEIPATVKLNFQSKVLNCSPPGPITIGPKGSTELKLDIYPRKVNPEYRKQLTLNNLTNPANDQIIEVRSTNIDKNRVTFHSLFYRVLYPGGSNFLDFGTVVVGGLALRMITVSNFTKNWLTLEVTTSLPGELCVYERAADHQTFVNLQNVSGLLADHADSTGWQSKGGLPGAMDSKEQSRGPSPADLTDGMLAGIDGSKVYLRRRDQRDHSSNISTEAPTPSLVGSSALVSSLALKAKAILFHGDATQLNGANPARFLDLATDNVKTGPKRVRKKIPTMKELLEPTKRPSSAASHHSHVQDRGGRTPQGGGSTPIEGMKSPSSKKGDDNAGGRTQNQHARAATNANNATTADSTPRTTDTPNLSSVGATAKPGKSVLNSVLSTLDATTIAGAPQLSKASDEEAYVKEKMYLARELQNALTSGELSPVSIVSIPPETEHQLAILFTPQSAYREHIKGIPKKQDARLFFRLVDFDREMVANAPQFRPLFEGDVSRIPLREIVVRSSLSGSIASGDIALGAGKSGVVRGYSKKEVDFMFEPTLSGLYHEKLQIENVQDKDSSRVLSVKANIRKPKHFTVDVSDVNFGACVAGERAGPQLILVTNSTKQTRVFEVRVDPQEMMVPFLDGAEQDSSSASNTGLQASQRQLFGGEMELTLEDEPPGMRVMTKEMEDEIEHLEQKLKIAVRKGREEKVKKLKERLAELKGVALDEEAGSGAPGEDSGSIQESTPATGKKDATLAPVETGSGALSAVSTPSSTPVIKEAAKFKRTDNSIVFTLEGGKAKSVSAYFVPSRIPQGPAGAAPIERATFQGKIYVHEHKNRDVCHNVSFFATVENAGGAEEQTPQVEPLPPSALAGVTNLDVAQTANGAAHSERATETKAYGHASPVSLPTAQLAPEAPSSPVPELQPPVEHLSVPPETFDCGRLEVGHTGTYYFKLTNSSDQPQPYKCAIIPDGVSIEESQVEGVLDPQETRRIVFGFTTNATGRLTRQIVVLNPITGNKHQFEFVCLSHRSQYLAFPSLEDSQELDLGYCYVDTGRKYSQVTPLLVENITDEDVYIACASNLAQQVGIFADEQAEKGHITRTLIKKRSMVTVWVAVQPNLLGGGSSRLILNSSNSSAAERENECRTLVGGIKFTISVVDANKPTAAAAPAPAGEDGSEAAVSAAGQGDRAEEELLTMASQTVKFTSLIGRSILSVSDTDLNLGWTPDLGRPVYGGFTLQNMSSRLPLDFHVESLSGNIVLDRTRGVLEGWDKASPYLERDGAKDDSRSINDSLSTSRRSSLRYSEVEGADMQQMDHSRMWISFRATVNTPGLFQDTILVTNKNNASQQIEINVHLFAEPALLKTIDSGPGYECPLTPECLVDPDDGKPHAPREGLRLPGVTWHNVYVNTVKEKQEDSDIMVNTACLQPKEGEEEAFVEDRWIEFQNHDDTQNSAPVSLELPSDHNVDKLSGFHFCGPLYRLEAGASVRLLVSCPSPRILGSNDIAVLERGRNVSVHGHMMVMSLERKLVVKAIQLEASFGLSVGEVLPEAVDVGRIGHYNSWKASQFSFDLLNEAEIPLAYRIVLPDSMQLVSSDDTSEDVSSAASTTTGTVDSKAISTIQVSLDPNRIGDFETGRRTFVIEVLNVHNPANSMKLDVHATLTRFELSFDRLNQGRLILPPLTHPAPLMALPCDSWFAIANTSPEDVRFEVGYQLSPEVEEYVRLEVLSRFSNSPLRGTISLSPKGVIEARVRMFPKEGSRLPSDTTNLCRAENFEFGKLWVQTKPSISSGLSEEELALSQQLCFAEDIPIYGNLIEGSMFTLSPQRVVFKSLLETSDYEDDSDGEGTGAGRASAAAGGSGATNTTPVPGELSRHATDVVDDDEANLQNQSATITVSNLSTVFPLEFQVMLEGPMEYPAAEIIRLSPVDDKQRGVVEAGQQLKLKVELLDPRVIISEDIKLYIRNLNSNKGQQQRVLISLVSDSNREHTRKSKKQQQAAVEDERIDPHHHQNKLIEAPSPAIDSQAGGTLALGTGTATGAGGGGGGGVGVGVGDPGLLQQGVGDLDDDDEVNPYIILRGCKRIDNGDVFGGRYELDLGQQDMGPVPVVKKLVLQNPGYERVSYRLKTISSLDKNWVKMSRTDGTLVAPSDDPLTSTTSPSPSDTHTITLSFSTHVRNVFSTYLLIENVDNPLDTKTIRITMEVVARQNIRRVTKGGHHDLNNRVFDVYVNGIDAKNRDAIDMKNLYYGSWYTARSMVVYNRETVPMEFTFKSNLSPSEPTEILFSTSRTSAKLFKTLTVPPENHVRVYIRFFPKPSPQIQAALDQGIYRDPAEMELKTIEIYINCRLVKDYQHVVLLTAECFLPAVRVDWKESKAFVGSLTKTPSQPGGGGETDDGGWRLTFQDDYRELRITNTLDTPLYYEIVNDTMYFNLEFPTPTRVVEGYGVHEIRVVPNTKALLKNAENFKREKYVQENITIYNKRRPLENYWIPLRLSFGNVSNFQLSSGYKSSYAFGMIEQHVVKFLADFSAHAVLVTMGSSPGMMSTSIAGSGSTTDTAPHVAHPSPILHSQSQQQAQQQAQQQQQQQQPGSATTSTSYQSYYHGYSHGSSVGSGGVMSPGLIVPTSSAMAPIGGQLGLGQQFLQQFVAHATSPPLSSAALLPSSSPSGGAGGFASTTAASVAGLLTIDTSNSSVISLSLPSSPVASSPCTSSAVSTPAAPPSHQGLEHDGLETTATTAQSGGSGGGDGGGGIAAEGERTGSSGCGSYMSDTQRKLVDLEFQYQYVVDQLVYYSTIKTGENFFQLASLLFCTLLSNRIFQIWGPAYLKPPANLAASSTTAALQAGGSGGSSHHEAAEGEEGGVGGGANRSLQPPGQTGSSSSMSPSMQLMPSSQVGAKVKVWPESLRKWVEALDYFVSFFPYHSRQLETLRNLHQSLILS
ncbi:hypothetical protein BGZ73_005157 [Actinomortierella ambigua]|nr:hypothetical protein BGZ73_005157 [Actinomortierella ambigua]